MRLLLGITLLESHQETVRDLVKNEVKAAIIQLQGEPSIAGLKTSGLVEVCTKRPMRGTEQPVSSAGATMGEGRRGGVGT